jgi:hypothetical protein
MQLGIGLQTGPEALQIRKAELLRNRQHLRLVALHLVQPDLVQLLRGQVGRGGAAKAVGIELCPIGQRPCSGLLPACGNVADLQKARHAQVGGLHFLADGVQRLGLDALLLGGLDGGRKVLQRQRERRVFRLLHGQRLHLFQHLFQQIFWRHAMVVHADGHIRGHLVEGLGDGVQPGDPVVVVLHRGEAQLRRQLRISRLNAAHLVQRHLPLLEPNRLLIVGKLAQQQIAADLLLVGEPGRVNARQSHQVSLFAGQPFVMGLHGVVGDAVVEALVAQRGGKLRRALQARLPILLKEGIESLAVGLHRGSLSRNASLCQGLNRGNRGNQHESGNKGQSRKLESFQGNRVHFAAS